MKNKVHIKDVKLGKYYQFGNHYHSISNYEIDLSNQAVKCIKNEIENKNHQSVWLQLGWAHPELTGEWENSPMFYFPDDQQYEKIYVKEITYEKAVSLLPKGKPILATW